jgi:hypothetical protein
MVRTQPRTVTFRPASTWPERACFTLHTVALTNAMD